MVHVLVAWQSQPCTDLWHARGRLVRQADVQLQVQTQQLATGQPRLHRGSGNQSLRHSRAL
jgi:hypothetical protein